MEDNKNIVKLIPSGKRYALAEDFHYNGIIVPKGFETDGISYKLRLVALLVNKFDPRYITAVLIHDYLCDLELYELGDRFFEELLPNDNISKVMILFVKMYHFLKYGTK